MAAKPSLSPGIRNLVRIGGLLAGCLVGYFVIGPLTKDIGGLTGAALGFLIAGSLLYLIEATAAKN